MSALPPLKVMTFNIGNGLAEPQRLAGFLRDSGADLIGLEEVSAAQAVVLDAALADVYPARVLHGHGIAGKGLLSRLPLQRQTLLELNPARPDLDAVLDWRGAPLRLLIVHPPPPTPAVMESRRRQLERLHALVAAPEPLILMGDLNMTQFQQPYRTLLASGLRDAFADAGRGSGRTFPRRRGRVPLIPTIRLDYIFHSDELTARDCWVGPDAGSDHLPLLALFERRAG